MSDARAEILAHIARALPPLGEPAQCLVSPGAGNDGSSWRERAARFHARATRAAATVVTVPSADQVPAAIADYLASRGLAPVVHVSGAPPGLQSLDPGGRLRLADQRLRDDGDVAVTGCLAAIAEEGALVLATAADHAAESAFLAATHIAVVAPAQLVDSLESLWQLLRAVPGPLPRMLNLILGPSRTADLGVPSRLGAHGPLRVHVILVGE